MADPPFDPWRSADEHAELSIRFDPVARVMGGGFHVGDGHRWFIVLDPDLDEGRRRVVLTHELVHHERGGGLQFSGAPRLFDDLAEREEQRVDAEVARRLVPVLELRTLVAELVAAGGGAAVDQVADHFAVTWAVAARALRDLLAHPPPGAARGGPAPQ